MKAAFDVNQYRHVAVVVEEIASGDEFAAIMTCSADMNGDLKVDNTDRGIINGKLCSGSCSTSQLEADLDCDGDVDSGDLGVWLGQYSGTSLCTVREICTCEDGGDSENSSVSMETALAMYGFASIEGLSAWLDSADSDSADATCAAIAALINS